jgi:hypothetical protein
MTDQWYHRLIMKGSDWDRRHRLEVCRGRHLISIWSLSEGDELLIDRSVLSSLR